MWWVVHFPRSFSVLMCRRVVSAAAAAARFYFLGLRTLSPPEMAMHRTTQEVTRVNSGHDRVKELFGPMLPETKELLQAVFAPFNAALAEFVGNPALCYNDDDDEADNEDQG